MVYDWKNMNVVPRNGLEAWHMYEPGVSANNFIADYSGKGRHQTCAASGAAVLTANALNGQPGWYFNGTSNPLNVIASILVKYIFIIASNDEPAFTTNRGLISGIGLTGGDALVSNTSGDTYVDIGLGSNFIYKKNDVVFANSNLKAPMGGSFAIMEVQIPTGSPFDGLQIGQQKTFTTRKHKGFFIDQFVYSRIPTELEQMMLLQYAAMRYHLWPQISTGLYVYPFPANKARSLERNRETYLSEPYDGDLKALVRGNFKRAFELPFALRTQAEFEAAEAFHEQHYPLTHFIHRDYRFYPARDSECRITSSLREQGSDVTNRFNYSFEAVETA